MAQRDERGRFIKGSQGGPGRPPMDVERAYLDAAISVCTPEKWADIVAIALKDCADEDYRVRDKARNFILKVLHGNAPAMVMQMANINFQDEYQDRKENPEKDGVRIYLPDNGRGANNMIAPESLEVIKHDVYGFQYDDEICNNDDDSDKTI